MTTLRLFLSDASLPLDGTRPLQWRLIDGPHSKAGCDTLSQVPSANRIELFLPVSRVLHTATDLPPGGKRQARKLLPFALDNVLLNEAQTQHIAFNATDTRAQVRVVDRKLIENCVEATKSAGLRLNAIFSAAELCPADLGHCLWDQSGWLTRQGDTALWFDAKTPDEVPLLLAKHLRNAGLAITLHVPAESPLQDADDWKQLGADILSEDVKAAALAPDAINLLQGDFAIGAQVDIDWSKLRISSRLVLACLAIATLSVIGNVWSMKREEHALMASMNSAFAKAFPGTPVIDARLQLASRLKGDGTTASPDDVLAKLIDTARSVPTPGDAKLQSFRFDGQSIVVDYNAPPERGPQLKQSLGNIAGEVSIPATNVIRLTMKLADKK